jgi:hypothetical protein
MRKNVRDKKEFFPKIVDSSREIMAKMRLGHKGT